MEKGRIRIVMGYKILSHNHREDNMITSMKKALLYIQEHFELQRLRKVLIIDFLSCWHCLQMLDCTNEFIDSVDVENYIKDMIKHDKKSI